MPSGVYERTPDMETGKRKPWCGYESKNEFYRKYQLLINREYDTPLKIVTVNIPYVLLEQIEKFKEVLYSSRSEAVRLYVMQGIQRDLELIRLLSGDFEQRREMFPENASQFTDRWGITWNIGRAVENV